MNIIRSLFVIVIFSIYFALASYKNYKPIDLHKSDHYFYSEDKKKILYSVKSALSIFSLFTTTYYDVSSDTETFKVLSNDFGKDKHHIFFKNKKITNVDYKSFYWDIKNALPKDKNHVYTIDYQTENNPSKLTPIIYADPISYESVAPYSISLRTWYRDKSHYFYKHKKTIANRETMTFDSDLMPFDNKFVFCKKDEKIYPVPYHGQISIINKKLIYDDIYVYYTPDTDSSTTIITYDRIESVRFYDKEKNIFSVDNKVFIFGKAIEADDVDPQSFEVLIQSYYKDKNQVYYKTKPIKRSDPVHFRVLNKQYAKDKNYVYREGQKLFLYNPKTFTPDKWGNYPADHNYMRRPREQNDNDE